MKTFPSIDALGGEAERRGRVACRPLERAALFIATAVPGSNMILGMRASITLQTLPPRPQPLSAEEISSVFGGCGNYKDPCKNSSDCCAGRLCDSFSDEMHQYYCT
jgi:hypothetical protein